MLTVDEASRTAERYWQKFNLKPNIIFNTSSVEAVRSIDRGPSKASALN